MTFLECWGPALLPGRTGVIPGSGSAGTGVRCLRRSGGAAPVPLRLQRVCGFFTVPFGQGKHLSRWYWQSIASCFMIAVFTLLCSRNLTPRCFLSRTSVWDFVIRCCHSSIVARENHPLASLAMFKARCISDFSRCTRPSCLAIVADMLKTCKETVAASNNRIQLVPQPYTLP